MKVVLAKKNFRNIITNCPDFDLEKLKELDVIFYKKFTDAEKTLSNQTVYLLAIDKGKTH